MAGLSPHSGLQCGKVDSLLVKFTFLRYAALGSVMLYRTCKLRRKATDLSRAATYDWQDPFEGYSEFSDHPEMTADMVEVKSAQWWSLTLAGLLFIQTEGVGLAIYFGTSAILDNIAVFAGHHYSHCKYVFSASLYTMALATFLPTAALGFCFQADWYIGRPWNPLRAKVWYESKPCFVGQMVLVSVVGFVARLRLVVLAGWSDAVGRALDHVANETVRVGLAAAIPPTVDVIQYCVLVFAGRAPRSKHSSERVLCQAPRAWRWGWFLAPSLMLCAAVLLGTVILPGGAHGRKQLYTRVMSGTNITKLRLAWPHEAPPLRLDDFVVRTFGTFLITPLVLPYCVAWARTQGGHELDLDQKRITVLFFLIAVLRLVVYIPIRVGGYNEYLSDHIFLMCSLVAQIQLMHGVLHARGKESPRRRRLRRAGVCYCLVILLLFFVEATVTSLNYHTRAASWVGYVTGTALFTGIAFWATNEPDEPRTAALAPSEGSLVPYRALAGGSGRVDS